MGSSIAHARVTRARAVLMALAAAIVRTTSPKDERRMRRTLKNPPFSAPRAPLFRYPCRRYVAVSGSRIEPRVRGADAHGREAMLHSLLQGARSCGPPRLLYLCVAGMV